MGIPPQKLAELRQGLAFTTKGTQGENGYGLGLCLVSKLVSQLGGSLEIDSTLEKGTRFSIAVPQKNETPEMIRLEKAMSLVA